MNTTSFSVKGLELNSQRSELTSDDLIKINVDSFYANISPNKSSWVDHERVGSVRMGLISSTSKLNKQSQKHNELVKFDVESAPEDDGDYQKTKASNMNQKKKGFHIVRVKPIEKTTISNQFEALRDVGNEGEIFPSTTEYTEDLNHDSDNETNIETKNHIKFYNKEKKTKKITPIEVSLKVRKDTELPIKTPKVWQNLSNDFKAKLELCLERNLAISKSLIRNDVRLKRKQDLARVWWRITLEKIKTISYNCCVEIQEYKSSVTLVSILEDSDGLDITSC